MVPILWPARVFQAMYTIRMKFILLAIGGFVLLLILNSFLGGNPLG
jgi:hypothetical protein